MSSEAMRRWRSNPENKAKERIQRKQYRLNNKEKIRQARREYALWSIYGISVSDYNSLLLEQQGRCAICGTTEPGGNRHSTHFHIDHNHKTGEIRGLLCCDCNRGLGILGDDVDKIERVLTYLKEKNG